jgi:uncharacterized protein YcbK (DUF882 family)
MPAWTAKYFTPEEFACRCSRPDCDAAPIHLQFLGMLDRARAHANVPFVITSGSRCARHNELEGGSATSSHIAGLAADIRASNNQDRLAIVQGLIHAGFTRIGIARGFVHTDIDPEKMASLWVYP